MAQPHRVGRAHPSHAEASSIPFGKYELIERINIGGMAEIVKARDTGRAGEPIVAVKRILPHLTDDRQFTTMFLDESRVLAQLEHENIIHTLDVGTVGETPYIALEYVFGQDARMLFHRSRRDETTIPTSIGCYVISQVCAGLHYAHEQTDSAGNLLGLVHRDISLQNILISYDGAVKLTDFGIAMSAQNVARTEAGIVKGKFGYMSPEQIKGESMDRRSDVFATGICLYELLTGERLFSGDSDYAAVEKVRNVDVPLPSTINRQIPSRLEEIVMRALAKRPRDRFQSAHDMRRALLSFMVDAHQECSGSDLSAYMREVFADDLRKLPTPEATAHHHRGRDEGTGLAAFDDLDPVSALSALNPEPAEPGPPQPEDATAVDRRPPVGMAANAPSVPPIVPRAESVPPGRAQFPPQAADASWQHELGFDRDEPLEGVEPLPEVVSHDSGLNDDLDDADVTRQIHVARTFPGLAVPSSSAPDDPSPLGAPSPFSAPEEEPTNVLIDPAATERVNPVRAGAPSARTSYAMLAAIALGIAGVVVAALYLARDTRPGTIHLTTVPRDATVEVNGERLQTSASPFVINGLPPEVEHAIRVHKEGFADWGAKLRVRPGQTLALPVVTLTPTDAPAAPETQDQAGAQAQKPQAREPLAPPRGQAVRASADEPSTKTARPRPRPRRRAANQRASRSAGESGRTGTLRLNSRPWSQVSVDGHRIGNTPQMNLQLSPGTHTIKLVNPEFGLQRTFKVTVRAGKTTTKVVDLQ